MRSGGKGKYFWLIFICFFILTYGFIKINVSKSKDVRAKSKFTIDLTLKPFDFRIDTGNYIFYVNNKIVDEIKEESNEVFNRIFDK